MTGIRYGTVFMGTVVFRRILAAAAIVVAYSSGAAAADLGVIDPSSLSSGLSRWIILDARPPGEWKAARIPGARSFSWENYTRTDANGVEYRMLPPLQMAEALGAMGINEKTPVVVYGDADTSWGGEGWDIWVLSRLGHKGPIRLLKGGIQAWRAHRLPLASGAESTLPRKERYQVNLNPSIDITAGEIERRRGSLTIVDVRSTLEWLKGRIPGSTRIPWNQFHTGKDRRPLSPGELRKLLAKHGIASTRPVVYYCAGGIRSAYTWLVHELANQPGAINYEGGMADWKKNGPQ